MRVAKKFDITKKRICYLGMLVGAMFSRIVVQARAQEIPFLGVALNPCAVS